MSLYPFGGFGGGGAGTGRGRFGVRGVAVFVHEAAVLPWQPAGPEA